MKIAGQSGRYPVAGKAHGSTLKSVMIEFGEEYSTSNSIHMGISMPKPEKSIYDINESIGDISISF